MENHHEDEFDAHQEVECSDECSEIEGSEPWIGPLSACAERDERYHGTTIKVACCPQCGSDIRFTGGSEASWDSDPERKAERQQMGICD